jgi:hypothetical protein
VHEKCFHACNDFFNHHLKKGRGGRFRNHAQFLLGELELLGNVALLDRQNSRRFFSFSLSFGSYYSCA